MPPSASPTRHALPLLLGAALLLAGACDRGDGDATPARATDPVADSLADARSPDFRNVAGNVAWADDSTCAGCHATEAHAYGGRGMAHSFHTAAFREAVHLDPSLGEALSYLVRVRTRDDAVSDVRGMEPPLPSVPARDRGPGALTLGPSRDVDGEGVTFMRVPVGGVLQILRADGTVLRSITDGGRGAVPWDPRTDAGQIVGGGLYRARVLGRDRSGRALPPKTVAFGIVRRHG